MHWTDEAETSTLIFRYACNRDAAVQMYLASFYVANFKRSTRLLTAAKEKLDFHNFARSNSCHMTEGIFGAEKHAANMETAKVTLFSELGNSVSHCFMFLQSINFAKSAEKGKGWDSVGKGIDLKGKFDLYRRARNACLHLPEALHNKEFTSEEDFSVKAFKSLLQFKDQKKGTLTLDFSESNHIKLINIWQDVLTLLESRSTAKMSSNP